MENEKIVATITVTEAKDGYRLSIANSCNSAFLPTNYSEAAMANALSALLAENHNSTNSIKLDFENKKADVNGKQIDLLTKEVTLLQYFYHNRDKIVTREDLLKDVWKNRTSIGSRTLDVHISRLRQKLGDTNEVTSLIQTIRGVGFRFNTPRNFSA